MKRERLTVHEDSAMAEAVLDCVHPNWYARGSFRILKATKERINKAPK